MSIFRMIVIFFAALALAGCAGSLLSGLSTLGASPSEVADRTTLDERAGIAVETMYAAAARAGALAFRSGIVEPSSDPEVQGEDFCGLVAVGSYAPSDRGGQLMQLECRLRQARDATRDAYDAGNARSYNEAVTTAVTLGNQLIDLIRGN